MINAAQDAARRGYRRRRSFHADPAAAHRGLACMYASGRRRARASMSANSLSTGWSSSPDDIDLSRSPLAGQLDAETYVLGAFNPGLTRLPNGNLLMMVRVAEALRKPIFDGHVHAIRWDSSGRLCARRLAARARRHRRSAQVHAARRRLEDHGADLAVLAAAGRADRPTGSKVVAIHYDQAVAPQGSLPMLRRRGRADQPGRRTAG